MKSIHRCERQGAVAVDEHMTSSNAADKASDTLPASWDEPSVPRTSRDLRVIAALADSAAVAIYHADTSGHMTYVNPMYREILGLTPEKSLDDWADGVHPQDRQRMQESWADFCLQPRAVQFQWRAQSKTGVVRFLHETVVPVATPGVEGFVGTITDVTELKEAQSEVENLHRQLMDASRQAGRAEVATSVLHNVGNVLNSVNVSANLVVDYVRNSKANGLSRVAALLEDAGADLGVFFTQDERGKRLPQYLAKLSTQIGTDQQQILTELVTLQKNIEHIKDIVAMQQSYAKLGGLTETVHVSELVEDALRLNEGALNRHGVTLQREFSPVGTIVIDKHKVLQVLVNLIRNAKYACDASGRYEKLLTVKVVPGGRGVQITVADNGVGIAPEHMVRIFHHGFTTKKEGHGFGLHSGALIAKELGGELRVQSEGIDRGASFTLDLPSQPPEQGQR